jgi:O-antigen/teichoic acid export membrane protein
MAGGLHIGTETMSIVSAAADTHVPPSSLRTLWQRWLTYSLSSLASRLVGFLMLPVYTRVLTPEEYGIRAMVTVGVDLVGAFCWFGLTTAMMRYYTGPDGEQRPEAVSTAYASGALVLGVGVGLGMLAAPWLAVLVLGDAAHAPFLRLGLASLFFMNTMAIGIAYLRLRQRVKTVVVVSLTTLALTLITNLVFVVWLRWGVAGILYGEILTFAPISLILAHRTLREVGVRISLALGRQMVAYGTPLMLMPLAGLLVNRSDGVFLTHHGSLSAVGIYALAAQCAQVLLVLVVFPFREVWEPGQFEIARAEDGARTYRRMFQTFSVTAVVAAFAFAVGAEDVIRLMAAPQFHAAADLVPILVLAYVALGISLFFESALLVTSRTALLGTVAMAAAVVNVTANAILVPRYFATGAACSRLLALAVMAVLTWALARRLWTRQPDLAALGKMLALAAVGFGISRLLPGEPWILSAVLKAALVPALVGAGVVVGAVERSDVARLITMLRDRVGNLRVRSAPDAVR